jgi:hypothetical protein
MAAEVARFLTEVAEFLTAAEVVALPMAVEAVPTVIDNQRISGRARPSPTRRAPFLFWSPPRIEKPAHNSLFVGVFNEWFEPGRFQVRQGMWSEVRVFARRCYCLQYSMGPDPLRPALKGSGFRKKRNTTQ